MHTPWFSAKPTDPRLAKCKTCFDCETAKVDLTCYSDAAASPVPVDMDFCYIYDMPCQLALSVFLTDCTEFKAREVCKKHEHSTWNGDEPCAICEANA